MHQTIVVKSCVDKLNFSLHKEYTVDGSILVNLKTTVRWQHGSVFDI